MTLSRKIPLPESRLEGQRAAPLEVRLPQHRHSTPRRSPLSPGKVWSGSRTQALLPKSPRGRAAVPRSLSAGSSNRMPLDAIGEPSTLLPTNPLRPTLRYEGSGTL